MEINEIAKSANEMLRLGILGFFSYYVALGATQFADIIANNKNRIKSKDELDKVVSEEAEKLGLDGNKIKTRFLDLADGYFLGYISGNKDGDIELSMPRKFGCTRSTVKHELVHVANKDYEHGIFHYLFIGEPKATLYGTFGIKV